VDVATARKRLEEMRAELDRTISVLQDDQPSPAGDRDNPQDPADAGTNLSEADRTEAMLLAAKRQRTEVAEALGRVDEGTYGTCIDCGKPIPEGRLEARPEAARCVACQAKHDRGGRR
jgi:DnaK suppressor protein